MKETWSLVDVVGAGAAAVTVASLSLISLDVFQVQSFFGQSWWLAFACSLLLSVSCALVGRGAAMSVFGMVLFAACMGFFAFLALYSGVQGFLGPSTSGQAVASLVLLAGLAVMVAALQRFRFGSLVLVAVVLGVAAVAESMYAQGRLAEYCLALLGAATSVLLAGYRDAFSQARSSDDGAVRHRSGGTASLAVLLAMLLGLSMAAGLAVYEVVLAPLDLPALRILLVTGEDASGQQPEPEESAEEQSGEVADGSVLETLEDTSDGGGDIGLLSMEDNPAALVVPILLLIVLAAYFGKRLHGGIQRFRVFRGSEREQLAHAYAYLIRRFAVVHLEAAGSLTPHAFVEVNRDRLLRFERGGGTVSFERITQAFEASYYGMAEPDPEDILMARRYCKRFSKAAVRFVGRGRYCIIFWLL